MDEFSNSLLTATSIFLPFAFSVSPSLCIPSLTTLLYHSLSPSPSCAVGSSKWRSSLSSGSVNQEENISTRGRVNKACYLATPPHLPLGTGSKRPPPLAEAAPVFCSSCYVTLPFHFSDGLRLKRDVCFGCSSSGSFCETLNKNRYPSLSPVTQQLVCTFFKQDKGGNDQFTRQRSNRFISAN